MRCKNIAVAAIVNRARRRWFVRWSFHSLVFTLFYIFARRVRMFSTFFFSAGAVPIARRFYRTVFCCFLRHSLARATASSAVIDRWENINMNRNDDVMSATISCREREKKNTRANNRRIHARVEQQSCATCEKKARDAHSEFVQSQTSTMLAELHRTKTRTYNGNFICHNMRTACVCSCASVTRKAWGWGCHASEWKWKKRVKNRK